VSGLEVALMTPMHVTVRALSDWGWTWLRLLCRFIGPPERDARRCR
jgi:hypothetical protein